MPAYIRQLLLILLLAGLPSDLAAQGARIAFGGLKQDTSLPVEISADQLQVNQADGTAVFSGNVKIGQGQMRLSADKVLVEYAKGNGTGRISRLLATGNVILVNSPDAAQAREAIYSIDEGRVVMRGDVILTQGDNALSSERMVINLKDGTAVMEGRVKSILGAGAN